MACASRTSSWPFCSSEPTLSRPTVGRVGAVHRVVEGRAHDRELDQLLGVALDVGVDVQHRRDALHRRPAGHDRRALQVAAHAQDQLGDRHQGAGVAGRDAGGGLAGPDRLDGVPQAGALAPAHGLGGLLLHGDGLVGVAHLD